MSTQRPGDIIPHQKATEGIIDTRLATALLAQSGSRDTLLFVDDLALPAGVTRYDDHPTGCYKQGGRVFFFGGLTVAEATRANLFNGSQAIVTGIPAGFAPDDLDSPDEGDNVFQASVEIGDPGASQIFLGSFYVIVDPAPEVSLYFFTWVGTPPDSALYSAPGTKTAVWLTTVHYTAIES